MVADDDHEDDHHSGNSSPFATIGYHYANEDDICDIPAVNIGDGGEETVEEGGAQVVVEEVEDRCIDTEEKIHGASVQKFPGNAEPDVSRQNGVVW